MGRNTSIEWTQDSWNPIAAFVEEGASGIKRRGWFCVHAGPDCTRCFAEAQNTWRGNGLQFIAQNRDRVSCELLPKLLLRPLQWTEGRRIFTASMTDLFLEEHSFEMIAAVYGVICATPWHTHQLLTKRTQRALEFYQWLERDAQPIGVQPPQTDRRVMYCVQAALHYLRSCDQFKATHLSRLMHAYYDTTWPPENLHLGFSAGGQRQLEERAGAALAIPNALLWLSYEPALEPLDNLRPFLGSGLRDALPDTALHPRCPEVFDGIRWVVIGGESGTKARPCDLTWIRSVLQDCRDASVPVFVKQVGTKPLLDIPSGEEGEPQIREDGSARYWSIGFIKADKGGDMTEWPEDLRVREYPKC